MIKVSSTYKGKRFQGEGSLQPISMQSQGMPTISVDVSKTYQDILGFGAAFTDSACYVIDGLPADQRTALLEELFTPSAMGLNVCRTCIGASDYARVAYSYAEVPNDMELQHFSIAYDQSYIIPVLRAARDVNPDLFLFASPWSPPGWMKTSSSMLGGWMREQYLEVYARYFLRFIDEYIKAGVRIDAVTPQNEVETDQLGNMPACYWHPDFEAAFTADYLKPLLESNYPHVKLWILDHNYQMWKRAKLMLDDEVVKEAVDGVAFHGYQGSAEMMTMLHGEHPETHVYWTEGGPDLGETYETDWTRWGSVFTQALRNWSRSITAWNLALDEVGYPNIGPFPCAGLVTIDSKTAEVTRSGQYWAMAHFSRVIQRGAKRTASTEVAGLDNVSFVNPNGEQVVVITNPGRARKVQVQFGAEFVTVSLPEDSLTTLVYS